MNDREAGRPRQRRGGRRDGLFRKGEWWWVDYYDSEGKRHRKKVAPDYQTAKMIYRDTMTAQAKGELLGVREEGLRVRDFVQRKYWPAVRATLAPEWATRSRDILDRVILPRFGSTKLSGVRQEAIQSWYTERLGQVSPTTANKELARLKHCLRRAVAWGYMRVDPGQAVKKAKEASGRLRYLTPEERDLLLEKANVTLRLYILAALHTGARRGELTRLRWADVDLKARMLTFRHTKNRHTRTVPLTDTLREALAALVRPLNPEAPVLPERQPKVVSRAFERLVKRLKLPGLSFHDLRHDAASTLTMAGVPQRTIMEILGHRDARMTMRYQHLSPGHLRDAMKALEVGQGPSRAAPAAIDAR